MTRRSTRIVAVLAAYALALHGLLAGMTLTSHAAAAARFNDAVICSAASDAAQDQGQTPAHDQAPCALHCLAVACPLHGAAPPAAAVIETLAPVIAQIVVAAPVEIPDRAAPRTPQSPRAPPLA
jgi:hypothetical protein